MAMSKDDNWLKRDAKRRMNAIHVEMSAQTPPATSPEDAADILSARTAR
jgi:hypothetical protein